MRMSPEERRSQMHVTRESIRGCERKCAACDHIQSARKLAEVELELDDGKWWCENCGREHYIV